MGLTFCMASDLSVQCPRVGGARGQNLEQLRIFLYCFFFFYDSFVFKQQVLLRVDVVSVTLDQRVQGPTVELGVKSRTFKKSSFFCFYFSLM